MEIKFIVIKTHKITMDHLNSQLKRNEYARVL